MCSMKVVPQSVLEIGNTRVVFDTKPKERSQKDGKHMEHPLRAGASFKRPDPLSQQRCKYNAGMTKAQKKHISLNPCVVPSLVGSSPATEA